MSHGDGFLAVVAPRALVVGWLTTTTAAKALGSDDI